MTVPDSRLPDPTINQPGPGAFYWISTAMFLLFVVGLLIWAAL